jgi:hypothetical protein
MRVGDVLTSPRGRKYKVLGPASRGRVHIQALWGFASKEEKVSMESLKDWRVTEPGDGAEIESA